MSSVRVLDKFCKGCGLCVWACPHGVLSLASEVNERGVRVAVVQRPEDCTGCANCYQMCPDAAIEVRAE